MIKFNIHNILFIFKITIQNIHSIFIIIKFFDIIIVIILISIH
jgi:hypothetical protein